DMNLLQSIKPGKWEDRELASAAREETFDFASGLGPDVSPHYGGRFGYLMQVKKPVIAAINGPAAGLGLVVALYADMRFAGSEAGRAGRCVAGAGRASGGAAGGGGRWAGRTGRPRGGRGPRAGPPAPRA